MAARCSLDFLSARHDWREGAALVILGANGIGDAANLVPEDYLRDLTGVFFAGLFFVIPAQTQTWKAEGLREAPVAWQLIIDLTDFACHRWFLLFPGLVIYALYTTWRARGKN